MAKGKLTRVQRRALREFGKELPANVGNVDVKCLVKDGMIDRVDGGPWQLTRAGLIVRGLLRENHKVNVDLLDAEDEIDEILKDKST